MNSTALVLFVGFLAYAALGGIAMRLWQRRTRRPRPANVYANPNAWLAYWLPQLIAFEMFALIGAGGMAFLLTVTSPLFKTAEGATVKLGFVIGVAGCAVLFAACDVVGIVFARRVARQQADARQDNPT